MSFRTWTQLSITGTNPGGRGYCGVAYVAGTGLVVFGGTRNGSAGIDTDVYLLNSSNVWSKPTTSGGPPSKRWGGGFAFDSSRGDLHVVTGYDGGFIAEHWKLHIATWTWTQLSPAHMPTSGVFSSACYDSGHDKIVYWPGQGGSGTLSEVWTYDCAAGDWSATALSIGTGPSARNQAAMVYDATAGKTLLIGGYDGATEHQTTWSTNLSAWTNETSGITGSPQASMGQPGAAWTATDGTLLVGGHHGGAPIDTISQLDIARTAWTTPTLAAKPGANYAGPVVYDSTNGRYLQFGGFNSVSYDDDVWSLPLLASIAVTPSAPSIAVGASRQMTATGTYADASTFDLTSTVTWSSGTPAAATISGGGLVTAVAYGTSAITATLGAVSGSTTASVVSIIGAGGTLIPWRPVSSRRTYGWRTNVLRAWDGTEHRASLIDYPRESFEASFELDADAVRYLRSVLFTEAADGFLLPDWDDGLRATDPVTSTTVTVTTTTLSDWAVIGRRVLVEAGDGTQLVTYLTGATSTTLTLHDAVPSTFARARVYPLHSVKLADGQPTGYYRPGQGQWRMEARSTSFATSMGTGATLTTFDGLDVLDVRRPSANGLNQEANQAGIELLDYGGIVESDAAPTRANIRRAYAFTWSTPALRQWWRKFLLARRGQQVSFLVPTWLDDLTVYTQPTSTSLVVYADDTRGDFAARWDGSGAHQWLQLEMTDGTILYRKIASVSAGGATDTLTLTASVNTSGANPDITRISFMERCRLADDAVAIDAVGPGTSAINLSMLVVQQ